MEIFVKSPDVIEHASIGLERVLAVALIAAMLLNVVNVVNRYVFGNSITGADELQIYLMVALAFLGSAVASARGLHLRMDVLVRYFPLWLRRLMGALEALGTVVLCGVVTWVATLYALKVYEIGSRSENAHIPMWMPHSVVAIAFAMMTLIALFRLKVNATAEANHAVADEVAS